MENKANLSIITIFAIFLLPFCSSDLKTTTDKDVEKDFGVKIGADGGTIAAEDGSWTFNIPASALSQETSINISTVESAIGSLPGGYYRVADIFEFQPDDLSFSIPCTMTIIYGQDGMKEGGLEEKLISFYYINDDSSIEKVNSTVDAEANSLEFEINHFSFGGPLTVAIQLINQGVITHPSTILKISEELVTYLETLPDTESQNQFLQDNNDVLIYFIEVVDNTLASNPLLDNFPDADLDGDGIINSIEPINDYAVAGDASDLTIDQLTNVGATNLVTVNLTAYQSVIESEISIQNIVMLQALIDSVNAQIEALYAIDGYASAGDASALTIAQLTTAGTLGLITENLGAYQSAIEAQSLITDLTALQTLIDSVNAQIATIAIIDGYAVTGDASALTIAELNTAGTTGLITGNLPNYQAAVETDVSIPDLPTLQGLIDGVNTRIAALTAIDGYAAAGNASGLTISELTDAGVTGLVAGNLTGYQVAIEAESSIPDLAILQVLIDNVNAQIIALSNIDGYAVAGDASALTISELTDAGVVGIVAGNLTSYQSAIEAESSIPDLTALQTIINTTNIQVSSLTTIDGYAAANDASGLTINLLEDTGAEKIFSGFLTDYQTAIESETSIPDLASLQLVIDSVNISLDTSPPLTTFDPVGGIFTSPQQVTITCTDSITECERIVYTTDGTMPSFNPQNGTIIYSGTIGPMSIGTMETDTHLLAMSEDYAGNVDLVRDAVFSVSTNGFIFFGTSYGLYRSVGPIPQNLVNYAGGQSQRMVFRDESNGKIYLTSYSTGLYISNDQRTTWVRRTPFHGLPSRTCTSVYASGNDIYVGTDSGIGISHDGGHSFTSKSTADGIIDNYIWDLTVDNNIIYLGTAGGFSKSIDGGDTWVNKTTADGMGANQSRTVAASGNLIAIGHYNTGISLSTDGGDTFENKTNANSSLTNDNGRGGIAISDGNIYVGCPGVDPAGISVSTDNGNSFVTKNNGMINYNLQSIFVNSTGIYSCNGYPGGLCFSYDGGENFTCKTSADGLYSDTCGKIYASGNEIFSTSGKLNYSNDGGNTWTNSYVAPYGLTGGNIRAIYANGNKLFVGTNEYGIINFSNNGGASWTQLPGIGLGNGYINEILDTGSILYIATQAGLSISTNGGITFENRTTADGLGSNDVRSVAINGNYVYVATGGGVSVSSDKGGTFVNKTTAHGLSGNSILVVRYDSGRLYASASGQYLNYSTNNGNSWTQRNSSHGIDGSSIKSILADGTDVYLGTNDGLFISTNSAGWFSARSATGVSNINIGGGICLHDDILYVGSYYGFSFSMDANFYVFTTDYSVRNTTAGIYYITLP
jgi:hypothetical protein